MNKTARLTKRLSISTETLRQLTEDELDHAHGGAGHGQQETASSSYVLCPSYQGHCPSAMSYCPTAKC